MIIKGEEETGIKELSWIMRIAKKFQSHIFVKEKYIYYYNDDNYTISQVGNWKIAQSFYEIAVQYCKKIDLENMEFAKALDEIRSNSTMELMKITSIKDNDTIEFLHTNHENHVDYAKQVSNNSEDSNLTQTEGLEIKQMIKSLTEVVERLSNKIEKTIENPNYASMLSVQASPVGGHEYYSFDINNSDDTMVSDSKDPHFFYTMPRKKSGRPKKL